MSTIVVASGKGGAGKTSVAAGLAPVVPQPVLVDADVDASNLALLLRAVNVHSEPFRGGFVALIDRASCIACGECVEACRYGAMVRSVGGTPIPFVDPLACEGCDVCRLVCPVNAIEVRDVVTGEWLASTTPYGLLVHADLGPGGSNSGRLVERVRREAERAAEREGKSWILVDGPPGVGCPTISAMTGADLAVLVAEPTPSGLSDLLRAIDLAEHLRVPACVVLNKADLDASRRDELVATVEARGTSIIGEIPYDDEVVRAIRERRSLAETNGPWRGLFESMWKRVDEELSAHASNDGESR